MSTEDSEYDAFDYETFNGGISQPPDDLNDLVPSADSMTAVDRLLFEGTAYANSRPSGVEFPILKSLGSEVDFSQAQEPLLKRRLGNVITHDEMRITSNFVDACQVTAVSGSRDAARLHNAAEVELFSVLHRLAECVPLIARKMLEGRWDEAKVVVEDARLNLGLVDTLQCVGRLAEDESNPELSPEDVEQRNFEE